MSKYSPLASHLAALQVNEVRFTFTEIEEVINDKLPPSAHKHAAWWSNSDRGKNGWANLWKRAGWVRGEYNRSEKWVTFQRPEYFTPDSEGAKEGYEIDRSILASKRNSALATKRKIIDNYTCQACKFRLNLKDKFVIEVHHLSPLGQSGETYTTLDKLVSLCPTCHRIAHLRKPPYAADEIKDILAEHSKDA